MLPAPPSPWRLALFCLAAAALVIAALLSAAAGSPAPALDPPASTAAVALAPNSPSASAPRAAVPAAARPFLAAFFRYEVGELGPAVRRALRANATPAFAAELLAAPPLRPRRRPPPAQLGRLSISVASIVPPRALVAGAARRGALPEQFSFLFEARHGVWFAAAPGQ